MPWKEVASGGLADLYPMSIPGVVPGVNPGDRVQLRIDIRTPVPDDWLNWIGDRLRDSGVNLTGPITQVPGGSATVIIGYVEGEAQRPGVEIYEPPLGYAARPGYAFGPAIPVTTAVVIVVLAILAILIVGFTMLVYVSEKFGWVGAAALGGLALAGVYIVSKAFGKKT